MATVLEDVGKKTIEHLDYVGSLNIQLWSTIRAMKKALPRSGTVTAGTRLCTRCFKLDMTLPMVSLMALCTGFIFALQGASELRRFGALHYVIDQPRTDRSEAVRVTAQPPRRLRIRQER